jgi:hypothetical protein
MMRDWYIYTPIMMNAAAPEGTPQRRISDFKKKSPCPAVPRRGPEAGDLPHNSRALLPDYMQFSRT